MIDFVSTASVSDRGWRALEIEEGCRLKTYLDSRGIPTIGIGHTMNAPSKIAFDQNTVWTKEFADHVFRLDSSYFVFSLNRMLHRVCTQQQFDAMFSMEFNIGMGGMKTSHLISDFNKFGPDLVTEKDFLAWAHPPELRGRREREWAMFSHGAYRL